MRNLILCLMAAMVAAAVCLLAAEKDQKATKSQSEEKSEKGKTKKKSSKKKTEDEAEYPEFPPHNYDQASIDKRILFDWYNANNKTCVNLGANIGIIRWLPMKNSTVDFGWKYRLHEAFTENDLWNLLKTEGWGSNVNEWSAEGAAVIGELKEPTFAGSDSKGVSTMYVFVFRTPRPQKVKIACTTTAPHEIALYYNYESVTSKEKRKGKKGEAAAHLEAEVEFGFCLNLIAVKVSCRKSASFARFSLKVEGEDLAQAACPYILDILRERQNQPAGAQAMGEK